MREVSNVEKMANEEYEFDKALELLSNDMIRLCYFEKPITFDWYYGDFLYTEIKYVAVIEGTIDFPNWMYPYAFWVMSMGPVIQSRHFFKLRYWDGFYVVCENIEPIPFENDIAEQIEQMLWNDAGTQSPMQVVREICQSTGVLMSPRFITLSRKARDSKNNGEALAEYRNFIY